MKSSDDEYRHQTLVHQLIIGAAFLTYLLDRDDIVWRFTHERADGQLLERCLFTLATIFIAASAGLRTYRRACSSSGIDDDPKRNAADKPSRKFRYALHLSDILYAIGLGSLAPLSGFVLLVAGETIHVLRLISREDAVEYGQSVRKARLPSPSLRTSPTAMVVRREWGKAFQQEVGKWGLFITMLVFTVTLRDRIAEVLAGASFLIWLALNLDILPSIRKRRDRN